MSARRLPGSALRARRGRRTDLPAVRALLGLGVASGLDKRFGRRLVADLGHDVHVAEDGAGTLVGVVAVAYVRSLAAGRWTALLDVARVRDGAEPAALSALLDLAEARARRRGCVELRAWLSPDDPPLRALLCARGWQAAAALLTALPPVGPHTAGPVPG